MKKILIFTFFSLFLIGSVGQIGLSFDRAAVEQLRRTNSCQECDLYKANLDNLNLTNADLQGANLKRAKFRKATLYGANLTGANTMGTNFEGAMWIDGTVCQKGSIGYCAKATK